MNKKVLITILVVSLGINVGLFGMILYRGISKTDTDRFGPSFRPTEPRPERHLPGQPGSRPPALPKWFEDECKLSDEQKEKIDNIFEESNEELYEHRKTIEEKRKELFDLINKSEPNLEEIDKKITEISALELEMEKMFARKIVSMRQVLTPEQVKLLDSHIDKHMRHGREDAPGFRDDRGNKKGPKEKGNKWGDGKGKGNRWGGYNNQGKGPAQLDESAPDEKESDGVETEAAEK
jgi:Spy/CpxP family protein refolding chaperone